MLLRSEFYCIGYVVLLYLMELYTVFVLICGPKPSIIGNVTIQNGTVKQCAEIVIMGSFRGQVNPKAK